MQFMNLQQSVAKQSHTISRRVLLNRKIDIMYNYNKVMQ